MADGARLTRRDGRIVEMRAGGMTLAAIGLEFGVTRQRVRQIIEKACRGRLCVRCRLPDGRLDGDGLCGKCVRLLEIVADDSLACEEAGQKAGVSGAVVQQTRRKFGIRHQYRKHFRDGVPEDVFDPRASALALTRKYGVGKGVIQHLRKKAGLAGLQRKKLFPQKSWTTDEDRVLVEMRRAGKTWAEIGESLGRSPQACRTRQINQRRKGIEMGAWPEVAAPC